MPQYTLHDWIQSHELFYSFAPACLVDTMVSAPALELVESADKYTLQALESLKGCKKRLPSFTL